MASITRQIVALLVVLQAGCTWGPAISSEQVRAVELGMSENDVTAILGSPLQSGPSTTFAGRRTLSYNRWRPVPRYPMLWVHLEEGKVVEVYAKLYTDWGTEDQGVYALSSLLEFESTETFEAAFPRHRSDRESGLR